MRTKAITAPPVRDALMGQGGVSQTWQKWFEDLRFAIPRQRHYEISITGFTATAHATTAQAVSIAGLESADFIKVMPVSALPANVLVAYAVVTSPDNASIVFANLSSSPIAVPTGNYDVFATAR